jgi:hypothetical protein
MGTSSFSGRKNFTGQTALFPSHILRKMQKQKNSQGSRMEIMGADGHGPPPLGCPRPFQSTARFDRVIGDAAYNRRHQN